jgi:hypothetical protein
VKLVKKLAKEWSETKVTTRFTTSDGITTECGQTTLGAFGSESGYIAGFKKALQLAQSTYDNRHLIPVEANALTLFTSIADRETE